MPDIAFASYANEDGRHDSFLKDFIRDLRTEIHQFNLNGSSSPLDCVFYDVASIATGEDWTTRISKALNECKVLVALCSPHFNSSQFCGKEVCLFLQRVKAWQSANANVNVRCIISVVWNPSEIPHVLAKYQFLKHPKDKNGNTISLRVLCKIDRYKDDRTLLIDDLANAIKDAWTQNLTPLQTVPHFDHIPNAFQSSVVAAPYGVAAVNLLKNGADPIAFDRLISQACGAMQHYRLLSVKVDFAKALQTAKSNHEAILIVADPETLKNTEFDNIVAILDDECGVQSGLIILDDKQINPQEVQGRFLTSHMNFWEIRLETSGEAGQRQALSEVIAKLKARLIAEAPSIAAHNIQIIDQAKAEGVPIKRKPIIIGPESPR